MPLKGKIAYFKRAIKTIWLRQMPYGLVSLAFLNPWPSPEVLLHRQLFCRGIPKAPRLIVFLINIGLWLRWVLFFAWREARRYVGLYGSDVASRDGKSRVRQLMECLWLALAHCVHPQAYYHYRLYRCCARNTHWSYVNNSELVSYHRRNANSEYADLQRGLLSHKYVFGERMRQQGVSVAESKLLPKGTTYSQLSLNPVTSYFLKPDRGSQSIGAFRLDFNDCGNPMLRYFSDTVLSEGTAVDLIDRYFGDVDYLLQPLYENDGGFSVLDCGSDEVIVLRIITWRIGQEISPYCAYLEIPVVIDGVKKGYLFAQVNTDSGKVLQGSLELSAVYRSELVDSFKTRLKGFIVPRWRECLANNILAHRQFSELETVAWDNVVTSERALILEGNSGWSVELPQMFCGGLVARALD